MISARPCRKACRYKAISIRWHFRIGGTTLYRAVEAVLRDAAGGPHIFNLGHGVTPDVKIENVQAVVDHVRGKEPNYV